jgi:DHA3 family macrolide efflux protein-like MFS transporter
VVDAAPAEPLTPEAPTPGAPTPEPAPHWRRHVAAFLGGQTVSLFGSMLVQYAVFWYITITFQSGVMMMLAVVFGFLPQALVSLVGGVWADRYNRRRLIILADATIAASTLLLAVVMLAGFTEPWLIFVTLAARSAGAGVQMPAVSALVPQITPPQHLMRVNGLLGSIQSAMSLLAPAIAGGLLAVAASASNGSPLALVPIFVIDLVTAAIGIGLLATIPVPTLRAGAELAHGYLDDLLEGFRYVGDHAVVRWVLLLFGIVFLLTVAPSTLTPLLVVRAFPSGEQGNVFNLAVLEMAFSGGMVLGGILVAVLAANRDRVTLIAASSLLFGALTIALGLAPTVWIFFLIMLVVGLAVPFFSTPSMTLLQETVEPERQGRVFGLMGIVMAVATPIGMVVLGPLADVVPIQVLMVATGLLTFLVVGVAVWSPAGRRAVHAVRETAHATAAAGAGATANGGSDEAIPVDAPRVPVPDSR